MHSLNVTKLNYSCPQETFQGQFMPHQSHGEFIPNVPPTLARGGMQAFSGHFTALWGQSAAH